MPDGERPDLNLSEIARTNDNLNSGASVEKKEYRSHLFGMVGFIKTLIGEVGMGDITKPDLGISDYRPSKFKNIQISPGQVFVFKK